MWSPPVLGHLTQHISKRWPSSILYPWHGVIFGKIGFNSMASATTSINLWSEAFRIATLNLCSVTLGALRWHLGASVVTVSAVYFTCHIRIYGFVSYPPSRRLATSSSTTRLPDHTSQYSNAPAATYRPYRYSMPNVIQV